MRKCSWFDEKEDEEIHFSLLLLLAAGCFCRCRVVVLIYSIWFTCVSLLTVDAVLPFSVVQPILMPFFLCFVLCMRWLMPTNWVRERECVVMHDPDSQVLDSFVVACSVCNLLLTGKCKYTLLLLCVVHRKLAHRPIQVYITMERCYMPHSTHTHSLNNVHCIHNKYGVEWNSGRDYERPIMHYFKRYNFRITKCPVSGESV